MRARTGYRLAFVGWPDRGSGRAAKTLPTNAPPFPALSAQLLPDAAHEPTAVEGLLSPPRPARVPLVKAGLSARRHPGTVRRPVQSRGEYPLPHVPNLLTRGNGKLGEGIYAWSLPAIDTCPGHSGLCSRDRLHVLFARASGTGIPVRSPGDLSVSPRNRLELRPRFQDGRPFRGVTAGIQRTEPEAREELVFLFR